jgi:hypothetical protein
MMFLGPMAEKLPFAQIFLLSLSAEIAVSNHFTTSCLPAFDQIRADRVASRLVILDAEVPPTTSTRTFSAEEANLSAFAPSPKAV